MLLLTFTMKHCFTKGTSRLTMPWQKVCGTIPVPKVVSLIDQWLLSSGVPLAFCHHPCPGLTATFLKTCYLLPPNKTWMPSVRDLCAEDAKFGLATGNQPAYMLGTAVNLMRMMSCSCGRPEFLQRSGMLLRCLHLMRHIVAACPATLPVCTAALWALQVLL